MVTRRTLLLAAAATAATRSARAADSYQPSAELVAAARKKAVW